MRLAESVAPVHKKPKRYEVGDIYAALDDLPTALEWYERSGRNYKVTYRLATTLQALEEYPEAAFFYRWTLRSAPYLHRDSLRRLAECYRHIGNFQAASQAETLYAEREGKR